MVIRLGVLPVLIVAAAIGGCDRQSGDAGQGADNSTPAISNAVAEAKGTQDRTQVGTPAPDYAFTDADGKSLTLATFKGKPVLVNLWATWCAPCVAEMPTLDALAKRETGKLAVLAISQDMDGAKKVLPYLEKAKLPNLVPYLDPDLRFSVGLNASLPTTILYDSEGREVWRYVGPMDWSSEAAAQMISEAK
ncbi:TlpA family protein disulfide reductase [Sphingomonas sp. FW199]|uniref:TlpA family protein disulfide reductase n=1 Tax=Sphingomonas sp. FW199 TaxID=3400217 RepID=UPI003CE72938